MLGHFKWYVLIIYNFHVLFKKKGDRVVSSKALFGSCHYIVSEILPRFGIEVVFVDGKNLNEWESALKKKTDMVFF